MDIIERHLDDTDFNVNIFAREMGMARTNLFTKLKAVTGQTPNDFILNIRLKKGAVMLRNNPRTEYYGDFRPDWLFFFTLL